MKKKRHALILALIEQFAISTQEELLARLRENGFEATQATVSRDIKELHIAKELSPQGVYCYRVRTAPQEDSLPDQLSSIFAHSVKGVDYAGNTIVLRCHNGMAQGACAALDAKSIEGLVGTIAGDDTIFALCRTEAKAQEITQTIQKLLG